MLIIFGAVAEREYILQRQREGIAVAKAAGIYKGRKPIEHPEFNGVIRQRRKGGDHGGRGHETAEYETQHILEKGQGELNAVDIIGLYRYAGHYLRYGGCQ